MENAFDILKKTFKELLTKTHLNVYFVPNVLITCLLHNLTSKN